MKTLSPHSSVSSPSLPVRGVVSAPANASRSALMLRQVRGRDDNALLIRYLLAPTIVTAILWLTRLNEVSLFQLGAAFLLFGVPWWTYVAWQRGSWAQFPMFSLIAAVYWLFYAVPLFWGTMVSPNVYRGGRILSHEAINGALLLTLISVGAMWAGQKVGLGRSWTPKRAPDIAMSGVGLNYVRAVLVMGTAFSFLEQYLYVLGAGGRQLIVGLQVLLPAVAFLILLRRVFRGEAERVDKVLVAAFLLAKVAVGLSSGWLGSTVFALVQALFVYVAEKRRVPVAILATAAALLLFLQPGKSFYRAEYWAGGAQASRLERAQFWLQSSRDTWSRVLEGRDSEFSREVLQSVMMRTSLLTQTANVLEVTPQQVPFQNGKTYSFLLAMWVPRALWPDKPLANDANHFYQVNYGLTTLENTESGTVNYASGMPAEAYINFGWAGVFVVSFLLGVLFDFVRKIFLSARSGVFLSALGLCLMLNFAGIEAQAAVYLGGILQQTALVMMFLLPVLRWKTLPPLASPSSAPSSAPEIAPQPLSAAPRQMRFRRAAESRRAQGALQRARHGRAR